jgi:4-hydroxybenzoate polyprenyltransferase
MRSIKAIIAGSIFILVVLFLLGLINIFITVGYNALAANFQFLKDITGIFRYLVGIPVFMVVMFAGGYITASIAKMHTNIKIWFHCLIVGLITVGGTMYSAMDYSSLTLTGIVVIILALSASSAGGFYWLRGNKINQPH